MYRKKFTLPVGSLRVILCGLLLAGAVTAGGCGTFAQSLGQVEGLDALGEVQVVSREAGSGTRSAFAELLMEQESAGTQRFFTRIGGWLQALEVTLCGKNEERI